MVSRRKRIIGAVIAAVAVLAAAGPPLYRRITWVEQDLAKLTPHAASQSYDALFRKLEASPPGPDGFVFVVLGDTRSDLGAARDVMSRALSEKPAFILNTGDLVRRGTVDEFIAHHLQLVELAAPVPLIPVVGNHEEGPNKDYAAFKAIYGAERFSFDYGGCRVVGVNNVEGWFGGWFGMSGSDLLYLAQEFSKSGAAHRFVIFHRPPYFMEKNLESEDGRGFNWNADALRSLMRRLKVNEVFVGHIHGWATEVIDGVRYTITGGGGAPLATTLGEEGNVRNYVVVRVTPQGVTNTVVRLLDGQWVRTEL